jgi:hypothetical protein
LALGDIFHGSDAVGGRRLSVRLALCLLNGGSLGARLVNVTPNLKIEVRLGYRSGSRFGICILALLPFEDYRIGGWLPRLEAAGCVTDDFEVAGKGGANV